HVILHHTFVHENITQLMKAFRHDAHPMGMYIATLAAMSTYYPEGRDVSDPWIRTKQIHRLIAKLPTVAAFSYRHSRGLPYVYPDNDLSYTGNFLNMLDKMTEMKYHPNPVLERALDVLFILHADHEQNCSTSTVRIVGSSHAGLFASISAGVSALWGPLHGGANQAVIEMLEAIKADGGDVEKYILKAKDKDDPFRLMGFGHRVYKNFDPRAKIIKKAADDVLDALGIDDPILDIAKKLEKTALEDEYFKSKNLYPNVDFYSGIIYRALGIPSEMFTVMFAVGRLPGWIAQWIEMRVNQEPIGRPRQIYTGHTLRPFKEVSNR
ncbi:MAG: citrate (Si)-synthase, partial [Flavobacteriales bacterium]|nr:citrate (Si)-synthase [Flavobacteriales bacterium]